MTAPPRPALPSRDRQAYCSADVVGSSYDVSIEETVFVRPGPASRERIELQTMAPVQNLHLRPRQPPVTPRHDVVHLGGSPRAFGTLDLAPVIVAGQHATSVRVFHPDSVFGSVMLVSAATVGS